MNFLFTISATSSAFTSCFSQNNTAQSLSLYYAACIEWIWTAIVRSTFHSTAIPNFLRTPQRLQTYNHSLIHSCTQSLTISVYNSILPPAPINSTNFNPFLFAGATKFETQARKNSLKHWANSLLWCRLTSTSGNSSHLKEIVLREILRNEEVRRV